MTNVECLNKKIWVTANYEKINVKDMTDSHLENTYNFLMDKTRRHNMTYTHRLKWIQIFFEEKVYRAFNTKLYEIY